MAWCTLTATSKRKGEKGSKEQYKEFGKEKRNMHKICHRNTVNEQVAKQKELLAALKSDCGVSVFETAQFVSYTG